jgi:hypothetical protein
MGYRHLTDFELQDALDGSLHKERPLLQLHLDRCELCGCRLADYRKIIGSLSSAHGESIAPKSVETIMSRIESIGVQEQSGNSFGARLGLTGAMLSAAASIVWVIARTDFVVGIRELAMSFAQSALSQTVKMLPLVSNNMLAFTGIAALVAMMAVDRVIRHRSAGVKLFSM